MLHVLHGIYSLDQRRLSGNVTSQYVFYNKHFKIANTLTYDDAMFRSGLWNVNDLFESDGRVVSFNTWKSRGVCKSKYMLWRGLVSKVMSFRGKVYDPEITYSKHIVFSTGDEVNLERCTSREIYLKLVRLKNERPRAIVTYQSIFPNLHDTEIECMFLLPRLCTNDNIIKEFQFKLLHRYLSTNELLFKMKRTASNKCTFCELYKIGRAHV